MRLFFLCRGLFLKPFGFTLPSPAPKRGCLVVLACFTTASINASLLNNTRVKTRTPPPLTFTNGWAILPSFPGMDVTTPSSLSTTAPILLSSVTKNRPTSACDPHCLHFLDGDPCCVSWLCFCVELLLHLLSCAQSQRCQRYLCTFSRFYSRCTTRNHSKWYISLLLMALAFHFCSSCCSVFHTSLVFCNATVSYHVLLPLGLLHFPLSDLNVI